MDNLLIGTSTPNSIQLLNPITSSKLLSLRSPPLQSLCTLKNEVLLGSESTKPFIHIYHSSSQSSQRIQCPGISRIVTSSPDGHYILVALGAAIHVWQSTTGKTLHLLENHYKNINCIKFNPLGNYFASAGEDGLVNLYNTLQVVSGFSKSPAKSWSDHSFSVKDLHVGLSLIFSVSLDRTCKIYNYSNNESSHLICSVNYPYPLTTVAVDNCESRFYVGSGFGGIYSFKLRDLPTKGGDLHLSSFETEFKGHSKSVGCMSLSLDGSILASSDAEKLIIWDTCSAAILKLIEIKEVVSLQFWRGFEIWSSGLQTIAFPDVCKLVSAGGEGDPAGVVRVVNNFSSLEGHNPIDHLELGKLKRKLQEAEEVNRKLHLFCVENLIGQ